MTSKCFAFRALNLQARIWKGFWVENSTSFLYLFPRRLKLGKSLQTCSVNFFRLSWQFKRQKSVFWKAYFCKIRADFAYLCLIMTNLRVQHLRLVRISLLIRALKKQFCFSSRENYFKKAIENVFSCVC